MYIFAPCLHFLRSTPLKWLGWRQYQAIIVVTKKCCTPPERYQCMYVALKVPYSPPKVHTPARQWKTLSLAVGNSRAVVEFLISRLWRGVKYRLSPVVRLFWFCQPFRVYCFLITRRRINASDQIKSFFFLLGTSLSVSIIIYESDYAITGNNRGIFPYCRGCSAYACAFASLHFGVPTGKSNLFFIRLLWLF